MVQKRGELHGERGEVVVFCMVENAVEKWDTFLHYFFG
jgi:hypothetical protein